MKKLLSWLKNEESGQGMVEYGLILALISVVVIVALTTIGTKLRPMFENVENSIAAD